MSLRTLTLADALAVTSRMRKADADCLHAVSAIETPEHFALNRWQTDGPAWTLLQDDEPVAICGISMAVPWCGVVWLVAIDGLRPSAWKKAVRHGRIVLGNASKRLRRVECHVLSTWAEAELFARRMGFEVEGVRRRAGRDGQDILTMVYRGPR